MSFKCQDLPPGHSAGWRICLGDEIQKSALGDTMDASTLRTGPSGAALASASKASTEIPGGQRQRRSKNSKETRTVNTNKYKSINYQISFIYSNLSVLSISTKSDCFDSGPLFWSFPRVHRWVHLSPHGGADGAADFVAVGRASRLRRLWRISSSCSLRKHEKILLRTLLLQLFYNVI